MTNKEQFLDEILNAFIPYIAVTDGHITHCGQGLLDETQCSHCLFNSKREEIDSQCCIDTKREWFNREYTPNFYIDWSKVEIDTPIFVRNYGADEWYRRHFAFYKDGKVYAYVDGRSSFTSEISPHAWDEAKIWTKGMEGKKDD